MESQQTWLEELANDVLQRQVDTIVTDGITGRSMPHPVIALLDINNSYFRRLERLGKISANDSDRPVDACDDFGALRPNSSAQRWLIKKAVAALDDPGLPGADCCILQRIVATCTSLMPIVAKLETADPETFKGTMPRKTLPANQQADKGVPGSRQYYNIDWEKPLPEVDLTRKERAALSKAWELGCDTVALQTTSMLGGGIITRVTEEYTGDAYVVVRQIHREAVNLSLTTWEVLASAIGALFKAFFERNKA